MLTIDGERVVRCRECGLLYQDPRPAEAIGRYHDNLYDDTRGADRVDERRRALFRGFLDRWPPSGRGRLLDVGCGSGKSFLPMLARGYEVTACDISPAMVDEARRKARGRARVEVADMRELPPLGEFDLITCLDDAVNYLLDQDELAAALESMGSQLAAGGLLVFDTNTLHTYRAIFSAVFALEDDGAFFCWRGEADPQVAPGSVCSATIEAFAAAREELWQRASSRHVQRHYPRAVVLEAIKLAALDCVALKGQSPGVRLSDDPDESRHTKLIYVARNGRG